MLFSTDENLSVSNGRGSVDGFANGVCSHDFVRWTGLDHKCPILLVSIEKQPVRQKT
jgi:hypothetical protein